MKILSTLAATLVLALGLTAPAARAQNCTPPTNVTVASPTTTSAVVSFSPVAAASSYTVRYFWTGDSTAAGMMNMNVTTSPATLTGLRPHDYYVVRVISNCGSGGTASSPMQVFQTNGTGVVSCAAPTNMVVSGVTSTTASIGFTGASGSNTYYVRYYPVSNSSQAQTVTVSASPAALTGLTPGTSYMVGVSKSCGNGTASGALMGNFSTTGSSSCAAPTNLLVSGITTTTATIGFTGVSGGSSYTVQYYPVGSNGVAQNVTVSSAPAVLTGLQPGTGYTVRITTNCTATTTSAPLMGSFRTTGTSSGCGPVTSLTAGASGTTTGFVAFSPIAGVSSYTIQYFAVGDSINAHTITGASSQVSLTGLLSGTTYVVYVTPNCNNGTAPVPARTIFTTRTTSTCGAVTNVVLTATSPTTATVSFTPGAGNTSFTVTYYTPGDSSHWVTSTSSPVVLTGLVTGQTYHVQVNSMCGPGGASGSTSNSSPPMTFNFRPGSTLSSRAQLGLGAISVFPNPAHRAASLLLPAVAGATKAQLALFNAVGQQVRTATVPLMTGGTSARLDLSGIAPGLYTLRVSAGGQSANQRIAVE